MKKYYFPIALALASLSLLGSCGLKGHEDHDQEGEEHAEGHAEHEHDGDEEEIVFTPEQAKAAGLETEKVKSLPFERTLKVTGRIMEATGDRQTITATASGIVSVVGQPLTEGMPVHAGQTMFSITSRGMEQSDPTVGLQIRYDAAKREYDRAKELLDDKIITQSEFTGIEEEFRSAAAALTTVSNRVANGSVSISCPINGYFVEQLVQPGQYVEQGSPLAVVSQNRRLQLRAEVPHQYASQIPSVNTANFVLPHDQTKSYSLAALNGHLVTTGRTAEASVGYIPVIFEFDKTAGLVPGTYVETYLLSGNVSDAVTVPISAISEEQGMYFVYIRIDDHGYRKQEVKLGNSNGRRIEITSGVNPGDEVVTKAVGHLKLAANTGQIPEGHSHQH